MGKEEELRPCVFFFVRDIMIDWHWPPGAWESPAALGSLPRRRWIRRRRRPSALNCGTAWGPGSCVWWWWCRVPGPTAPRPPASASWSSSEPAGEGKKDTQSFTVTRPVTTDDGSSCRILVKYQRTFSSAFWRTAATTLLLPWLPHQWCFGRSLYTPRADDELLPTLLKSCGGLRGYLVLPTFSFFLASFFWMSEVVLGEH